MSHLEKTVQSSQATTSLTTLMFDPALRLLPEGQYVNVGMAYLYLTMPTQATERQEAGDLRKTLDYSGVDDQPAFAAQPVITVEVQGHSVVIEGNSRLAQAPATDRLDVFRIPGSKREFLGVTDAQARRSLGSVPYVATLVVGFPDGSLERYWLSNLESVSQVQQFLVRTIRDYLEMPYPAEQLRLAASTVAHHKLMFRLDEGAYQLTLEVLPGSAFHSKAVN